MELRIATAMFMTLTACTDTKVFEFTLLNTGELIDATGKVVAAIEVTAPKGANEVTIIIKPGPGTMPFNPPDMDDCVTSAEKKNGVVEFRFKVDPSCQFHCEDGANVTPARRRCYTPYSQIPPVVIPVKTNPPLTAAGTSP